MNKEFKKVNETIRLYHTESKRVFYSQHNWMAKVITNSLFPIVDKELEDRKAVERLLDLVKYE